MKAANNEVGVFDGSVVIERGSRAMTRVLCEAQGSGTPEGYVWASAVGRVQLTGACGQRQGTDMSYAVLGRRKEEVCMFWAGWEETRICGWAGTDLQRDHFGATGVAGGSVRGGLGPIRSVQ